MKKYGYVSFLKMCESGGHDPKDFHGFVVKSEGIWQIPADEKRYDSLSATEREARFMAYDDHDTAEPVLKFPCTRGELLTFLNKTKFSGMVSPDSEVFRDELPAFLQLPPQVIRQHAALGRYHGGFAVESAWKNRPDIYNQQPNTFELPIIDEKEIIPLRLIPLVTDPMLTPCSLLEHLWNPRGDFFPALVAHNLPGSDWSIIDTEIKQPDMNFEKQLALLPAGSFIIKADFEGYSQFEYGETLALNKIIPEHLIAIAFKGFEHLMNIDKQTPACMSTALDPNGIAPLAEPFTTTDRLAVSPYKKELSPEQLKELTIEMTWSGYQETGQIEEECQTNRTEQVAKTRDYIPKNLDRTGKFKSLTQFFIDAHEAYLTSKRPEQEKIDEAHTDHPEFPPLAGPCSTPSEEIESIVDSPGWDEFYLFIRNQQKQDPKPEYFNAVTVIGEKATKDKDDCITVPEKTYDKKSCRNRYNTYKRSLAKPHI